MKVPNVTRLILLRHAPVRETGRQFGSTDVDADCRNLRPQSLVRRWGPINRIVTSSARRSQQTIEALFPAAAGSIPITGDRRLWEQDFGDWEGLRLEDLPDLGALRQEDLARLRPPNGESFLECCRRTQAAIRNLLERFAGENLLLCIHAGSIRATLALALGVDPGVALRFQVTCLSSTTIRHLGADQWSVDVVSAPAADSLPLDAPQGWEFQE